MDQNDWAAFYRHRPILKAGDVDALVSGNRAFFRAVRRVWSEGARIVECGCGPGHRMLAFAKVSRATVVFLDRDPEVLRMAIRNRDAVRADTVVCEQMDFFGLREHFMLDEFGVATHHGVLEHYEPEEIRRILSIQLAVVPAVVFAVPIESDFNVQVFQDSMYRNLWSKDRWIEILAGFHLDTAELTRTNKDELVVVLTRECAR